MAAKNKQRKKPKAANKVSFEAEENDMEAEQSGGEEDEDKVRVKNDEEELSLDEVLRLGGTQVREKSNVYQNNDFLSTNSHLFSFINK